MAFAARKREEATMKVVIITVEGIDDEGEVIASVKIIEEAVLPESD